MNNDYPELADVIMSKPVATKHSFLCKTADLTPLLEALYEKYGKDITHDSVQINHWMKDEWEISFEARVNGD